MELLGCLRRGVVSGAVGGALAGVFGLALAEPAMDRAVQLEASQADAGHTTHDAAGLVGAQHAEVFSRGTQHVGLIVASIAAGLALGVLFGLLYAVRQRTEQRDAAGGRNGWRRALALGSAAWFAVSVVPFVRYPANPPGVGDPDSSDTRTRAYFAALAIGTLGVIAVVSVAGELRRRHTRASHRQLAVAGVLIATVALTFALPGNTDSLDVPAGLLWQFRLLALVTSTLLWAGLTVTFGLLAERAEQVAAEQVAAEQGADEEAPRIAVMRG